MRRSPLFSIILGILFVALALLLELAGENRALEVRERAPGVPPSEETSATQDASYRVVRVVDGDTFIVEKDGAEVRVRLIGLDTPETVDPRKTVQCFGTEASQKARELLEGTFVRLETDPTQDMYDTYGRLLAYAYLPSGMNVAEHLIIEGYGHEYTYRFPYRYKEDFEAAEKTAREEKRGLWADDACAD
jgi:micrococcal nuclease